MAFISEFLAQNPEVVTVYKVIRAIAIVLDIALLAVMFYSLRELVRYRPKLVYDPRKWQKHVKVKKAPIVKTPVVEVAWSKIQSKLKEGSQDGLRLAIVEADGVVDEVLKRMGLAGEHFADRLGHLSAERYASLDKLWEAHRIRNNLVHTPDFHISPVKAEETLAAYEAFLKEAKAL